RMVESIAGDTASERLLIADEDRRHQATVYEYTFSGHPTGRRIAPGTFLAEPEGIALWACNAEAGYWVVADQLHPLTIFRVFDRGTLAPRGAFSGELVAWTDGIALHAAATARFPAGVLYAVHDDRAVAAFDLRDIVKALSLDPACAQ
ncbi:MAG: phytase, partial [Luteimonas sp.]|nr:phytase [Luteimonas sp.]